MIEEGYRYSKTKIISWIIAMVLGIGCWYGIGYGVYSLYNYCHPTSKKIEFRYGLGLIEQQWRF